MSADNGWILRRNQNGMFCLQMFSASADEYPKIELLGPSLHRSADAALRAYEKAEAEDGYHSEYGLRVQIEEVTYDHQHKLEPWGSYGKRCAVMNCIYIESGPLHFPQQNQGGSDGK